MNAAQIDLDDESASRETTFAPADPEAIRAAEQSFCQFRTVLANVSGALFAQFDALPEDQIVS